VPKKLKKPTQKKTATQAEEWEHLLSAQMMFQSHFPECVLVGGTAAAIHVGHRISLDADYTHSRLKERFSEILTRVEAEAGWRTKRLEPPVLILGNFQGVRTGIRQLIRLKPLETMMVRGLKIPTPEEILRIKAYLIVKRNATRDYIDFIALFDHLGTEHAFIALSTLDSCYPQDDDQSMSQQLALQLAEPKPWDLFQTDLSSYRNLQEPYTNWKEIQKRVFAASQKIITAHCRV